jgi:carbon storage regulator
MLVLSRKKNEAIYIGKDVKIVVLSVNNGVVKLGFEAPKEVNIVREELLNKE